MISIDPHTHIYTASQEKPTNSLTSCYHRKIRIYGAVTTLSIKDSRKNENLIKYD